MPVMPIGFAACPGRNVQLLVIARRLRCDAVLCGRQIFAERLMIAWRRSIGEPTIIY